MAKKPIGMKRHFKRLSEKEADAVVDAVADLIVNFLRGQQGSPPQKDANQKGRTDETD